MLYHESGHRVVADSTLDSFKKILSSYNVAALFMAEEEGLYSVVLNCQELPPG